VTGLATYPERGPVLVIGLDRTVNRSVVEPLLEHGVNAQGFTRPQEATDCFDARDFDLIVFGRGVLGPTSERLKTAFIADNPDVRFVDVIAPIAVGQTLAALAKDPRTPQFISHLEVSTEGGAIKVTATILVPCALTFTVYRSETERLAVETVHETNVEVGPFSWTGSARDLPLADCLLVTAAGVEYHLHPFLDPASSERDVATTRPDPERGTVMDARINLFSNDIVMKFAKYINAAGRIVTESALPSATQELVKLRASQINGCGFCADMHAKDAAVGGETQLRLNLVATWREATVFSEAERAALELAEEGTRIADAAGGVTDEAWANAARHYDDEQLGVLVAIIALIIAYNRLNVITRQPAGDYQPAQFQDL
jgi:AhpD family alkylhydroperoxidase